MSENLRLLQLVLPPLFKKESGMKDCSRETWVLAWCTSNFLNSISIVLANALVSANLVLKSNISICGLSAFWSDSASLLLRSFMVSCWGSNNLKQCRYVCVKKLCSDNRELLNMCFYFGRYNPNSWQIFFSTAQYILSLLINISPFEGFGVCGVFLKDIQHIQSSSEGP